MRTSRGVVTSTERRTWSPRRRRAARAVAELSTTSPSALGARPDVSTNGNASFDAIQLYTYVERSVSRNVPPVDTS